MTRLNKYGFIFIVLSVFGVMLILNFLTPFLADDHNLLRHSNNLGVLKAGYSHYFNTNGRAVLTSLAFFFLPMPKAVFNICNSLMFTWLTLLIYFYANPAACDNKRYNLPLYLFILFLIGTQSHLFGQTFLWISGSINYLWGIGIILSFVFIYYWNLVLGRSFFKRPLPANVLFHFMFLGGFIAGACNENTSGGGIILIIAMLAYGAKCGNNPRSWHFSGLLGAFTGFLFLVMSPGGAKRAQIFKTDADPFLQLFDRIVNCTLFLRDVVPLLVLIFVVLFIVQAVMNKNRSSNYLAAMLFLAAIATAYALILSPFQAGRAMFGPTILLMTSCAYVFGCVKMDSDWGKILTLTLTALLGVQFFGLTIQGGVEIAKLHINYQKRVSYIVCQREAGAKDLMVTPFPLPKTKYSATFGISDVGGEGFWVNDAYGAYFGLNSITAVDRKKWDAEYKNINPQCGVPY